MSRHIITLLSIVSFFVPSLSYAFETRTDGPYFAIAGSYITADDVNVTDVPNPGTIKYDDELGGSLFFGYNFEGLNIRTEGEVSYQSSKFKATTPTKQFEGDVSPVALMANVYYDLDLDTFVVPYIGAGAGLASSEGSTRKFAYQLRAGIAIQLTPRFDVYSGYRYFNSTNLIDAGTSFDPSSPANTDYTSHSGELGLRYFF